MASTRPPGPSQPLAPVQKEMRTTNIFISGLPMDYNEDRIAQTFGMFGPLASVKIMWPRVPSDYRGYLTGFVAFMSRKCAERALTAVRRGGLDGLNITVDWGKPVPIPQRPFYEHPAALSYDTTGLPFNAQQEDEMQQQMQGQQSREEAIYDALVRVASPKDRDTRRRIHRTIEFVIREGPEFEHELMARTKFDPKVCHLLSIADTCRVREGGGDRETDRQRDRGENVCLFVFFLSLSFHPPTFLSFPVSPSHFRVASLRFFGSTRRQSTCTTGGSCTRCCSLSAWTSGRRSRTACTTAGPCGSRPLLAARTNLSSVAVSRLGTRCKHPLRLCLSVCVCLPVCVCVCVCACVCLPVCVCVCVCACVCLPVSICVPSMPSDRQLPSPPLPLPFAPPMPCVHLAQ